MHPLDDTIAAIASPPGGAARGIVRISGPEALECLTRFFQTDDGQSFAILPNPGVVLGTMRFPDLHAPLSCDAYLWPEGRSYTGQPVVEIHTLGSPPLLALVLRSICSAGARLAGPGEFTLRAFLAGRIDLTQAEAVLGVIDAGDSEELHIALEQLAGGLARPLHRLRDSLLDLLAHLEAGFDFADEDLSLITREELLGRLSEAENNVAAVCRQMASRAKSSHGARIVLVGCPNTGKSSLFNVLAGDRAALVSDQPGTTRDYLYADLDLDGVKCRLIDTAGMGDGGRGTRDVGRGAADEGWSVHQPLNDEIDRAAASAAAEQRRAAHLQILCIDSTRPLDACEHNQLSFADAGRRIIVLTKCDAPRRTDCTYPAVEISSITGLGIAELREVLRRETLHATKHGCDVVAGTAVRCAESLRLAGQSLQRARQVASAAQDELAAAEIHTALVELGKVVGEVYTEDVLDRIFSRFCVGK